MAKLSLLDFGSNYQSYQNLNANNALLEAALEKTLSRDGTAPNQMEAVLDMNGHKIINVPAPSTSTDLVRYEDILALAGSLTLSSANVFSSVISIATAPPGSPNTGDTYLVAPSGTSGVFIGHENQLAQWSGTAWSYTIAFADQSVLVQNVNTVYHHAGTSGLWVKRCVYISPGDVLQTRATEAAGITALFLPGTYTSVNIVWSSGTQIQSFGEVILQTTSTTLPIWDFTSASNCTVRGRFVLQGNGSNANTAAFPLLGLTNNGQTGIKLYNSYNIDIDGDIEIKNISGFGIDEHAPASAFSLPGGNSIKGVRVHDTYFGFYVRDYAEYSIHSGNTAYKCVAGLKDEAGNRGYYNCQYVYNGYGIFLDGTVLTGNNSHGIVSGCFINHNTTNITCDGTQLGMLFNACQILSEPGGSGHGLINIIDGAKLINFVGCGLGSDVNIDATSQASFIGNTIRSTLMAAGPIVAAGGQVSGTGNYNELGATASLFNGTNSLTPVLQFGGASVGITYSLQSGRYHYADGYIHFTLQIVLTSKGSSTGVATITGIPTGLPMGPVPNNSPIQVTGAFGATATDPLGFVQAGTSTIKLFNWNAGALTQMTDTFFTGTDTIYVSGFYPLG